MRQPGKPPVHLLASASPLFDTEGKARGSVGAYIDVTSRKHLEDLLSERADLLEFATEAIIVRDMQDIVQYWNAGAEALYGWNREEVVGKPVHVVLQTKFPHGRGEAEASLAQPEPGMAI